MMRLPWIEDCENCGFVSIFLLYPCKRSFTCTETPKNKGTDFSKGKVRHDNHQLLQPITNQNNKNNCDKLMTRRMESLNISRRELLKEFFALTPKQKKMMMKKISIFNLVMFIYKTTGSLVLKSSTKVKLHALFISTKETKLRRRVE